MTTDRENREFFPGFALPPLVRATSSFEECLAGASIVVLVVPTQVLRATLESARSHLPPSAPLVVASKGIESGTLLLPTEIIEDVLGGDAAARAVGFSGPSFANEVALGMPTNIVAAAKSFEVSTAVQQRLSSERLRIYSSDDPVGVQMGGALKNVIAIAAGAVDGLQFGHNTRAALITRGLGEIARISMAKGGRVESLAGLAGLGDLVLTCTGEASRNRTVGYELGQGRALRDVLAGLGHVAEGVTTARSAYDLARQLDVDVPICTEVYRVLYEDKAPLDALRDLLRRPLRKEWG
jgi:glycerol-3-phosphate dehydrogenase (NAD(P)+)